MTDRRENRLPVIVRFEATDANKIPVRVYEKDVEFDREDWNNLDGEGRREMVQESFTEWLHETFDLDYSIVSDDDYDDESFED